jgi:hypothetical protein
MLVFSDKDLISHIYLLLMEGKHFEGTSFYPFVKDVFNLLGVKITFHYGVHDK